MAELCNSISTVSFGDYLVLYSHFTDEATQAKKVQNIKTNKRIRHLGLRTEFSVHVNIIWYKQPKYLKHDFRKGIKN